MQRPDFGVVKASCPTPVVEYIVWLEGQLAECYRLSGADPSGGLPGESDEDWRLAQAAVDEVRELRKNYDIVGDGALLQEAVLQNVRGRLAIYTDAMVSIDGRPYTCSRDLRQAVSRLQARLVGDPDAELALQGLEEEP